MPADVPKDAARRIKSIRTQYGLRQIELADRLGVTQVTVSRWEQAKSTPQPSYWRRIELAEKKGLKWLTESEEWARVHLGHYRDYRCPLNHNEEQSADPCGW